MTATGTNEAVPARRWPVISALGITQILAWGGSYYLPAVLAGPVSADLFAAGQCGHALVPSLPA